MAERTERRIILLGKVGAGKSATGNTILSRKRFPVSKNHGKLTTECSLRHSFNKTSHLTYRVLDTPGIGDEDGMLPEAGFMIQQEIIKCCREPHVFVLVVDPDDCTMMLTVVNLLQKWFGISIRDHIVVAFTKGTIFKSEEYFHAFIRQKNLSELLDLFDVRLIRIENHGEGRGKSLRHLLSLIESVSLNGKTGFRFNPKPWYQFKKDFGLEGSGKDLHRPEDVKLPLYTKETPAIMGPLHNHLHQIANDSNKHDTEEPLMCEKQKEGRPKQDLRHKKKKRPKSSFKQDKPTSETFTDFTPAGEEYGARKKTERQYNTEENFLTSSRKAFANNDETFRRQTESSPHNEQEDSKQICKLDEIPYNHTTLTPARKPLTRRDVCKTVQCAREAEYAVRNFKENPIFSTTQLALIACDEDNVQAVTNVVNSKEVHDAVELASSFLKNVAVGIGNFVGEVAEEIEKNRKLREREEARKKAHFY